MRSKVPKVVYANKNSIDAITKEKIVEYFSKKPKIFISKHQYPKLSSNSKSET